jgi:hypothetical protein
LPELDVHSVINRNKPGRRLFFSIACLLVVCGLFWPFAISNLWWREALNSGHVILFFFISLALYFVFSARSFFSSTVATYFVVLLTGLAIGVVIEISQTLFQREGSIEDLYKNFLGMMSGLGFIALTKQKVLRNKILAGLFSFSFFLLGFVPLLQISWDYLQREKAFPFVTAFEEKWFVRFFDLNHAVLLGDVALVTKAGKKLYRVRLDPGKYSGVDLIEPEANWSAYHKLRFQVFSDNASSINLVLKIYDEKHNQNYNDRFNQSLIVRPGLNEIVVNLNQVRNAPINRKLDLANISNVQLFLINVESSLFLGLSDLLLEK